MTRNLLKFAIFCFCCSPLAANADIVFTFTEATDGGVIVEVEGSGTVTGIGGSGTASFDNFDFNDFSIGFLDGGAPVGPGGVLSTSILPGPNSAVASGIQGFDAGPPPQQTPLFPVESLLITRGLGGAGDDLSISLFDGDDILFTNNNTFSLNFTAVFEQSVLDFDSLEFGDIGIPGSVNLNFGDVSGFVAVPEPASGMVILASLFGMAIIRRKS